MVARTTRTVLQSKLEALEWLRVTWRNEYTKVVAAEQVFGSLKGGVDAAGFAKFVDFVKVRFAGFLSAPSSTPFIIAQHEGELILIDNHEDFSNCLQFTQKFIITEFLDNPETFVQPLIERLRFNPKLFTKDLKSFESCSEDEIEENIDNNPAQKKLNAPPQAEQNIVPNQTQLQQQQQQQSTLPPIQQVQRQVPTQDPRSLQPQSAFPHIPPQESQPAPLPQQISAPANTMPPQNYVENKSDLPPSFEEIQQRSLPPANNLGDYPQSFQYNQPQEQSLNDQLSRSGSRQTQSSLPPSANAFYQQQQQQQCQQPPHANIHDISQLPNPQNFVLPPNSPQNFGYPPNSPQNFSQPPPNQNIGYSSAPNQYQYPPQ